MKDSGLSTLGKNFFTAKNLSTAFLRYIVAINILMSISNIEIIYVCLSKLINVFSLISILCKFL